MRAWDITLMLILIQACIGMLNGMGVFDVTYFASQNDSATTYTVGDISDLHDVAPGGDVSQMSYFDLGVTFVMAGLNLLYKIIEAIVFIFPTLVTKFYIPIPLAAVMQTMIYLQVAWGYAQWKSSRSGRSID